MRILKNTVPDCCTHNEEVCLGIDEAGRGPVLGPMVYGAAYWPVSLEKEMKAHGFDDSKALTKEKREELFEALKATNQIGYIIIEISARDISARMLRRTPYNLNAISHDAAMDLVRTAQSDGVNVTQVFVDTVGSPQSYQDKLNRVFGGKPSFTVEKKADSKFPVVSAASICAKVTRDKEMDNWRFEEPGFRSCGQLGSGYPGDGVTKTWLASNIDPVFGFSSLVRFSWSTATKILDEKTRGCKWPDLDELEQAGIKAFTVAATKKRKRASFFELRGLSHISDVL